MAKKRNNGAKREIKQVVINEDGSQSVIDSTTSKEPAFAESEEEKAADFAVDEIVTESTPEIPEAEVTPIPEAEVTPIPVKRRARRSIREPKSTRIHSEVHETKKKGRVAAVAVTLVFSLLLSMCVGSGLALWDSGRTVSDLGDAIFDKDVSAAVRNKNTSTKDTDKDKKDKSDITDTSDWETLDEASSETENEKSSSENIAESKATESEEAEDTSSDDFTGDTLVTGANSGVDSFVKAGSGDEIVIPTEPQNQLSGLNPNAKYPLPFTTVDESYFTDALFIGDSRLQGFGMWSGLPATYYCATGFSLFKYETAKVVQTENGKVPIFDALPYDAFTKIYIKVGLNEMGWDNEKQFEEKYAELIAKLREYEPRAIIYVHGVLPVTAEKSASDSAHNNPNVLKRNEALQAFAAEQKAYYIDAGPALSDENGNLRSEMTSDGIHLSAQYMKLWKQFLCEHAVVVR